MLLSLATHLHIDATGGLGNMPLDWPRISHRKRRGSLMSLSRCAYTRFLPLLLLLLLLLFILNICFESILMIMFLVAKAEFMKEILQQAQTYLRLAFAVEPLESVQLAGA